VSPRADTLEELFTRYLDTLNSILRANQDALPLQQLVDRGELMLDQGLCIDVQDPVAGQRSFTTAFVEGQLEPLHRGPDQCALRWTVTREAMEEVVNDPARFHERPLELDLAWLRVQHGRY